MHFFFQFADLNAVKILIGNKCDNTSNRKVSIKEGQEVIIFNIKQISIK